MIGIMDSSTIISLSTTCNLWILEKLHELGAKFVISEEVKFEVVDRAIHIDRFMLEGMRVKKLIEKGVLEVKRVDPKLHSTIFKLTNSLLWAKHRPLKVIHDADASCLALANQLNGILIVDETNLRLIAENPKALREKMERRLHTNVRMDEKKYSLLRNYLRPTIRSVELAMLAYEKGLLDNDLKKATILALKKHGCSISDDEINEYVFTF